MNFNDMIAATERRREQDAARYAALDHDQCMICDAYGADKRSLLVSCMYAVEEVVPEAIDLWNVYEDERRRGYYLLICKACRASFLGHMQRWADERRDLRGIEKDHDGNVDDWSDERNIPVRINGTVKMMTLDEFEAWKENQ